MKEYQKEWYLKNKKEHSKKSRERYYNKRTEILEQEKIYRQKNKEKISEKNKKRNSMNILQRSIYKKNQRERWIKQGKCLSCGVEKTRENKRYIMSTL